MIYIYINHRTLKSNFKCSTDKVQFYSYVVQTGVFNGLIIGKATQLKSDDSTFLTPLSKINK